MISLSPRIYLLSVLCWMTLPVWSQQVLNTNTLWKPVTNIALQNYQKIDRHIYPSSYLLYELDLKSLKSQLVNAPLRGQNTIKPIILTFPNSAGVLEPYEVYESPILAPDLAAQYPMIKTYVAQGIADPTAYMRLSVTQFGLHTFTLSGRRSTTYIDPYTKDKKFYIVYDRNGVTKDPTTWQCLMGIPGTPTSLNKSISGGIKSKSANDQIFRTFRLALSCTAEYGNFFANTGTELADIQAAMAVTMNRVNGVYEVDLSVNMQIVSNNDLIMYWGSTNSDPWTTEWNNTTQTEIDSKIGNANYDIGHNFNTAGGGNAGCISCVCTSGQKGSGYTGGSNPVGDPFDIDYVAHEMGHQFGGYHTMNTCSRSGSGQTEVEPASGSSIMGYAGICGTNVQNNSDAHFNYVNIRDMTANIQTGNSTCGAQTSLSNNPPVADAGQDFTIPQGTAFVLEGSATDADGLGSLTHNWSQNDPEQASSNGSPQSTWTQGPLYRAKLPIVSTDRYMPQLSDVIAGNLSPTWEMTPTVGRDMEFSYVVRDNDVNGAQEHDDLMQVTVIGSAGPFEVTSQGSAVTWNSGSTETITWDVANTSGGSVNTADVDIFLSLDGGYTYPITIVTGVPNNGSTTITVPTGAATTTGRIMVRGANNIFYDLNDADITILDSEFAMNFSNTTDAVCPPSSAVYNFSYNTFLGFNETTVFSATGEPAGSLVGFSPATAVTDGTPVIMTVSGITGAMAGSYTITITGTAPSATKTQLVTLDISDPSPGATTLTSPTDGATGVTVPTTFTWTTVSGTGVLYDIDIASDVGFTTMVDNGVGLTSNTFTSSALNASTTYYWRVNVYNSCGSAPISSTFSFETNTCVTYMSTDVPKSISSSGTSTITSDLVIPLTDNITDVNVVNLTGQHTWINDLVFTLQSPVGTQVVLFDQICNNQNDFDVNFDDQATPGALPCPPVGGGIYLPEDSLAFFIGEDPNGTWILTVDDIVNNDGGSLDTWGLEVCTAPPVPCIAPNSLVVTSSTDSICSGASITLSSSGNLNSATDWQVYRDSCGGPLVGTGSSVSASPTTTTTYYVRGEGGCITPGACATVEVVVNSVYADSINTNICDGTMYIFPDGSTSTTSVTQTSTLTTVNGCDSIITTALWVTPVYNISENASICGGVQYTFPDGDTSSSTTIHTSFLTTFDGCDSTITTTLTEDSSYSTAVSANICPGQTYTFPDNSTSTTSTTQMSTLTSIGGCDSVVTTILTVAPIYNLTESVSVCSGSTHTFPDGTTSSTTTTHTSSLSTIAGCDSIITSTLSIDSPITYTENVNSCSGVTYVFPDGAISTVSITHISYLTTPQACDSIVTTNLTVDPAITSNINTSICNGGIYTFPDGTTSSTATVQASYMTTADGCDSIIFTNLGVGNAVTTTEDVTVCAGATYTFPDGTTATTATVHTSNLTSVAGCDSTVTSNLTITIVDTNVTQSGAILFAAAADSYQWIVCEGNLPIGGAIFQSYTVTVNGSYKVALVLDGCKDTSLCRNVVAVGVLENSIGPELTAFPNPTNGHFVIDIGRAYNTTLVQVIDLQGKVLLEEERHELQKVELNIASLAQGMYLVKVNADGKQALLKLFRD